MRRVKQGKDKRNKDSAYIVRWCDGIDPDTGKDKWFQKSFKYKLEADRFAAQKRTEEPEVADFAAEPMLLGQFLREWSKTRRSKDYRVGTRKLDENTIARLKGFFGNETRLCGITPMQAEQFVAGLSRMDNHEPLSAWSRARTLRNARTIFNRAVSWRLLAENPFSGMKRPKPPESNWYYLPPDEFYALLNAAKSKRTVPLRCKVIYALAYCCGLRLGEILSLTWADNLKIERRSIAGAETFTGEIRVANRPGTADQPPFYVKDKESREIRVPQRCLELLLDLRAYNGMTDQTPYVVLDQGQYKTMAAKWQRYREQNREWQNRDMANNTLVRFKRHVRWAGINPQGSLAIHTLRKCCITNWANSINNPEVVRKLAGHSDIKTTMTYYTKVTEEQRRKAAEATDRLLEMGLAASSSESTGTY